MLRLQLLAALQQQQLQPQRLQCVSQLQQLLPAAVAAALPVVQQQQQHQLQQHLVLGSCLQHRSAATSAADAASSTQSAVKLLTKHEKRVAHLKFCQERAAWRRQVKALRMQWLSEIRQQRAQQRQATEAVKQEIERLKQLRSADKQHDREKHQLEKMLWEAERAVASAERRLASARREEMRQQTLKQYRDIWRQDLEVASRTWIASEDLEARIAEALDNPQHM